MDKTATTKYEVLQIIKERWSPRSFSEEAVSQDDLVTMLEAASWSFSSFNEQPWRYITALKGTENFESILSTLVPFNAAWAKKASAFIVSFTKMTTGAEGEPPNPSAIHDAGAANMLMTLQAKSMDIYVHPMSGFNPVQMTLIFETPDDILPLCVFAVGRLGNHEDLPEPYDKIELKPRERKPLEEIML